jgi:hypothetical protein
MPHRVPDFPSCQAQKNQRSDFGSLLSGSAFFTAKAQRTQREQREEKNPEPPMNADRFFLPFFCFSLQLFVRQGCDACDAKVTHVRMKDREGKGERAKAKGDT